MQTSRGWWERIFRKLLRRPAEGQDDLPQGAFLMDITEGGYQGTGPTFHPKVETSYVSLLLTCLSSCCDNSSHHFLQVT